MPDNPWELLARSRRAAVGLMADSVATIVEMGRAGATKPAKSARGRSGGTRKSAVDDESAGAGTPRRTTKGSRSPRTEGRALARPGLSAPVVRAGRLVGLRERAHVLGGELTFGPDDEGHRLHARLPLRVRDGEVVRSAP